VTRLDLVRAVDYVPTPTQATFLRDRTPTRLLCGGLGSGKTLTGAWAALAAALENQGRGDGMLVAPSFPMLDRLVLPAWKRVVPRELIRAHRKIERRYILTTGDSVWYGTADVPASLEGTNLAWFWGDEVRYWPLASWQNMVARVRVRGARSLQRIATSTPAMGWMSVVFERGVADRRLTRISTRENAPNLDPSYIPTLEAALSPRLARALIEGEFVVLEGAVYAEEWQPERNVIHWEYDKRFITWLSIDFGARRPSVLLAQQVGDTPWWDHRTGRQFAPHALIVLDELHPDECPTMRLIPRVRELLAGRRVDQIACDPAGAARDQASGLASVELLRAEWGDIVRYTSDPLDTSIPAGIDRVRGALCPSDGSPPRLYVERRLARADASYRGLVKALAGYAYPVERDGRQVSDHPVKDGTYEHAMDALRYLVTNSQPRPGGEGRVYSYSWGGGGG